eukprot:Polyplicarium_translucidae@DN2093_c0_g1_i3.p2
MCIPPLPTESRSTEEQQGGGRRQRLDLKYKFDFLENCGAAPFDKACFQEELLGSAVAADRSMSQKGTPHDRSMSQEGTPHTAEVTDLEPTLARKVDVPRWRWAASMTSAGRDWDRMDAIGTRQTHPMPPTR